VGLTSIALLLGLLAPADPTAVEQVGGGLELRRLPGGGPQKGKVSVLGVDAVRKGKREPEPQKPFRSDIVPHGPYGAPPVMLRIGGRMGGAADAKDSARKYSAKQRFMELTEKLRADMRKQARDKTTRVALFELNHRLLEIWRDPRLPVSIRKQRLFDAWDECTEPEANDKVEEHPGARARRRIEQFIRVNAKRGSDDGFSDAELRDMNGRRKSKQKFAPYDR
jgi:hypothetical protein